MIYHAIGLMSGTSLDGLDICHASFQHTSSDGWQFQILNADTVVYSPDLEKQLRNARTLAAEDLFELNASYGKYIGGQVRLFTEKHGLSSLDVIGSHGHTVFHQPHRGFTVQIGDGRAIKMVTGTPVVYDFRSADVLRGGNGAPLVPIGDKMLFGGYGACLNLGGFSNISMDFEGVRIAFDICPVNIVLNHFSQLLGEPFDIGGRLAAAGKVDFDVLKILDQLDFYNVSPPKSLGAEWVSGEIMTLLSPLSPQTVLATFTEHAANQISLVLEKYAVKDLLITGGGAYNEFLLERIRLKTRCKIMVPAPELVEFKEALIFAFMAVLRLRGENNILASATGSDADHCSGLLA